MKYKIKTLLIISISLILSLMSENSSAILTNNNIIPGTVVFQQKSRFKPSAAGKSYYFLYWSRTTLHPTYTKKTAALSGATLYLPKKNPRKTGWPLVAWAHGTVGQGNQCAPSHNPIKVYYQYFFNQLLNQGYAIIATDYIGLGTPGIMPYLNGISAFANIVDSVVAAKILFPHQLNNNWSTIGFSQGAQAAMYTAKYIKSESLSPYRNKILKSLHYLSTIAVGIPAYLEKIFPKIATPKTNITETIDILLKSPGVITYSIYLISGLRSTYPQIYLTEYLTPLGLKLLFQAEHLCADEFYQLISKTEIKLTDLFKTPLANIPNFNQLINNYLHIPETNLNQPIFIAQGIYDTSIITPATLVLIAKLEANQSNILTKLYPEDHLGTFKAAIPDILNFLSKIYK